jgi:hypothetical protein
VRKETEILQPDGIEARAGNSPQLTWGKMENKQGPGLELVRHHCTSHILRGHWGFQDQRELTTWALIANDFISSGLMCRTLMRREAGSSKNSLLCPVVF